MVDKIAQVFMPLAFDNEPVGKDDMDKRSRDNANMLPYWEQVTAIIEGQDAVRDAGTLFMPQFDGEDNKSYDFRRSVSKFTNIFADNVETIAAKPFEEEIDFVGTVPELIQQFAEDVDGAGTNMTAFASDVFEHAIPNAIDWIYVDYPEVPEDQRPYTQADAKALNNRPIWSRVTAANVLEVKERVIRGKKTLTYIRILEPDEDTPRVRVFERADETGIISWELWKKNEGKIGNWILERFGTLTIDVIPFVPVAIGKRVGSSWQFKPPLKNALNLQKTLYLQESGLEYIKILAAFPMLSGNGVRPAKDKAGNPVSLKIGPQTILYAPPDGDGKSGSWAYVEPSGQSMTFMQSDIDRTKNDLRELGKQPLTAQSGNITVITSAIAGGKAKSAVKAWALLLKNGIENALVISAKWLSIDYDPEISVYDDYDEFIDVTADLTALKEARASGDISRETYLYELKRRRVLSAEFDFTAESKRLLDEMDSPDYDPPTPDPAPGDDDEPLAE